MPRRRWNAGGATAPDGGADMANKQDQDNIPYDRALFYFAPEYLGTPEAWQATFRRLSEDILAGDSCGGKITHAHGYSITVSWDDLELTLDARAGTFSIWENDRQDDEDWVSNSWAGHETIPHLFIHEIWSGQIPDRLLRSLSDGAAPFARAILRKMVSALEQALDEKRTEIRYFPSPNKKQEFSDVDESYEPIPPLSEKLFFVVLPRATPANYVAGTKAVDLSKADGRFRHDWKQIDLFIQEKYARIRLKTFRTRTEIIHAVEAKFADRSPSNTMLHERIKKLFPNF